MDIIKMTRELGKALQQDDRFLVLQDATQANDNDQELQKMIEKFNQLRAQINQEASKEDGDQEKVKSLDAEFQELYKAIVTRPNMIVYNKAKTDMDKLLGFVNQILIGAMNGEDPDTIEEETGGCSGSCSSCSGCH